MPDHCRHCAPTCRGGTVYGHNLRTGKPVALWHQGESSEWSTCPACAESERIAAWLTDQLNGPLDPGDEFIYPWLAEEVRKGVK